MQKGEFLKGRRALVTGAASGIGLAVARELESAGADVIMSDVQAELLGDAASGVPRARWIVADLTCRDSLHALAREAGDVDILVNSAGLQHVRPIEDFEESKWDLLLATMLTAPFLLVRKLLPSMFKKDWGRIINVGSVHSLVASPYKSAYVAAKHGLMGLTKAVALEAAARSQNVTVNTVCPSYVRTPLVEKQIKDQARVHGMLESEVVERVMLTQNAQKRLIEPQEVGECIAFLCSSAAASITGTAFPMDSGWLAH